MSLEDRFNWSPYLPQQLGARVSGEVTVQEVRGREVRVGGRVCGFVGGHWQPHFTIWTPVGVHILQTIRKGTDCSRIELALRIPEPGKNWNINETFWFNTPWVSINTKKKLTVVKNREDTFWGYFPRWPPSAILENELLIYWPYKYV